MQNFKKMRRNVEYVVCKPVQFNTEVLFPQWSLGSIVITKEYLNVYVGDTNVIKIPLNQISGVKRVKKDTEALHIRYTKRNNRNDRDTVSSGEILVTGPISLLHKIYEILLESAAEKDDASCPKLSDLELKILYLLHLGAKFDNLKHYIKDVTDKEIRTAIAKLKKLKLI